MSPLPWIFALTVTLLHWLSASPIQDPRNIAQKRARETLEQIKTLKNIDCPTANSTFYINSDVNEFDHIVQMLHCATKELEVVGNDCFKNAKGFEKYYRACFRTNATINEILKYKGGQNKPTNLSCEGTQKPYTEFLNDLTTLIQKLNAKG